MVFFFRRRWRKSGGKTSRSSGSDSSKGCSGEQVFPENDLSQCKGTLKGLIIEEDGLDVLYWKRVIEDNNNSSDFNKEVFDKSRYQLPETTPLPAPAPPSNLPQTPPAVTGSLPTPPPAPARSAPEVPPLSRTAPIRDQVELKRLSGNNTKTTVDSSSMALQIGESLRYNGDIMEALFGSVATNKKCSEGKRKPARPKTKPTTSLRSEIYILDVRKSRSTAILVRSLVISRQNIIDAVLEGEGLNAETLHKLTKIAPTKEEQSEIIAFDGDITKLAEAESFLYHLLKPFPSAFDRFNALLFRTTFSSEIGGLKETLKTIEVACNELTDHGLILKLLISIVKSGYSTNVGSPQAFNLSSFLKVFDPTSLVGNATLLHLVMDEIVEAEAKCSRNHESSIRNSNNLIFEEDQESRDTTQLVRVLSSKFLNVKKAAETDYGSFVTRLDDVASSIAQTRRLLAGCGYIGDEGFVKVTKSFLHEAVKGINQVKEEQKRVVNIAKTTAMCYRIVEFEDNKPINPLETFVVLRDFFVLLDRAFIDISKILRA